VYNIRKYKYQLLHFSVRSKKSQKPLVQTRIAARAFPWGSMKTLLYGAYSALMNGRSEGPLTAVRRFRWQNQLQVRLSKFIIVCELTIRILGATPEGPPAMPYLVCENPLLTLTPVNHIWKNRAPILIRESGLTLWSVCAEPIDQSTTTI
jgi:hypothetical protein